MPQDDLHRPTRALSWRIAGLWMVVLALGLAVSGVFLAIQQARSFTYRLMAQAEAGASRIADTSRQQFHRELADALASVARHVCEGPDRPWEPSQVLPVWIDGVYSGSPRGTRVLVPPSDATPSTATVLETHIEGMVSIEQAGPEIPKILYDSVDGTRVVIGWIGSTTESGEPLVVAGGINLERLKSQLVEPMLSTYAGLELVTDPSDARPWVQPLYSALKDWWIQPTDEFVREHDNTVLAQTLIYLGLTVLALAALLGAMWVLVRVMRREMALAAMKANFVADVSHELKTPLALIHMFGETLQSGRVASEEKRQEYYGIIVRESTRLTNLINNILDFSQIEAGRSAFRLEPIDVGHVVRETYQVYRMQLEQAGFEHDLKIEPDLPLVEADRGAIARAIINLVNNAIKYAGDERYLAIDVTSDTRRNKRGTLISVHDRGIGIKPVERAQVTDGFFRSSDQRVRQQRGAGLGLSLIKSIVEAHRGSFDIESRLVKGSTFRIFLPGTERTAAEPGSTVADPADTE